jgi:hypothetical protein
MSSPLVYEINTRCWLRELSLAAGGAITLETVPDSEFSRWQQLGFTHIWLMGVWSVGPRSRRACLADPHSASAFSEALPDWTEEDVAGWPFAISRYRVADTLGGGAALAGFRERLRKHGMRLLLDFVPNHVGLDHRWVRENPELFVQTDSERSGFFAQTRDDVVHWIAHGKDPNFPCWTDTAQLDLRLRATQAALIDALLSIAERCDGVRCDLAMLVLPDVFEGVWKEFPCSCKAGLAARDFWSLAIPQIKHAHRDFLFLAEAYWGLEPSLQSLGFDFTYDKSFYDAVISHRTGAVERHLAGLALGILSAGARFLENHDEVRIASLLSFEEQRAAALLLLGLPGLRLMHDGQLTGARVRNPVQLSRRQTEPAQAQIQSMYASILKLLTGTAVGRGIAEMLTAHAGDAGERKDTDVFLIQWQVKPTEFYLVIVNLADEPRRCRVVPTVEQLADRTWTVVNLLSPNSLEVPQTVKGIEIQKNGLDLCLSPHAAHVLHFHPLR